MIWNPWKTIRELELKILELSTELEIDTKFIINLKEQNIAQEELIKKQTERIKELTNKIYKQKQELKNNKMKWS